MEDAVPHFLPGRKCAFTSLPKSMLKRPVSSAYFLELCAFLFAIILIAVILVWYNF